MATSESGFKKEFRDALLGFYKDSAHVWTNNDMFRSGLPDFSALYQSDYFAIEAKYVKELPVRGTSKVLDHELTATQATFLQRTQETGGYGVVLIGFADIAVAVPFWEWSFRDKIPESNITLERVKFVSKNLSFPKRKGHWDVSEFFKRIKECAPQRLSSSPLLV